MSDALIFFRDWVPTLAVIVGGAWILFRWLRDERLRGQREMPALYGQVETLAQPLCDGKTLLCVQIDWSNTSPYPVFVDPEQTRCDLYKIDGSLKVGPLVPTWDLGEPMASTYPLAGMGEFVFEPSSENQLRGFFVVPAHGVFLVRTKVYRDREFHGGRDFAWTRETIVDTRAGGTPLVDRCRTQLPKRMPSCTA